MSDERRFEIVGLELRLADDLSVDELFELPYLPRRTELIDQALFFEYFAAHLSFMPCSQLVEELRRDDAAALRLRGDASVLFEDRCVLCPDVYLVPRETFCEKHPELAADESFFLLAPARSIRAPERDRKLLPSDWPGAEDRNFWRVENQNDTPAVHTYRWDPVARDHVPTGVHSPRAAPSESFGLDVDLVRV